MPCFWEKTIPNGLGPNSQDDLILIYDPSKCSANQNALLVSKREADAERDLDHECLVGSRSH